MRLKNSFFKALILTVFFMASFMQISKAQNITDLRINEILVINDSSITDEYNQRGSWIEIYNAGGKTQNLSGFYFSDDPKNPTKYHIPAKTQYTYVAPYGYLIFWTDNKPEKGVRHLNFTLKNQGGFIGLYDVDGNTMDELYYGLAVSNISVARKIDGENDVENALFPTPNFTNNRAAQQSNAAEFVKYDPFGLGMTMISMSVVFIALVFLYLVFRNISRFYESKIKKTALIAQGKHEEASRIEDEDEITGDELAAAFMAIHLYLNSLEDQENAIITMKKVSRTYSPWSSKIYGLSKNPRY